MPSSLCNAKRSQLLIVDVQTRLAAAMLTAERERTLRNIAVLIESARLLGVPIVVTEQYPKGLGPTEAAITTRLPGNAQTFAKTSFSCCGAQGLLGSLDPVHQPQVVLGGMEAHVCVLQTAFDLQDRGYEVFVVEDAVCSRDPEHRRNALARMARAGVVVTNTESVAFEWLRDAAHPQFRAVSALLKA